MNYPGQEVSNLLIKPESLLTSTSVSTQERHEKTGATGGLAVRTGMKGKPKPLYFWTSSDVNKWLKKHGGTYYELYGELLSAHEVTGCTLIRMTDIKLEKMGITDATHRHDLMQYILRLRLKHEYSDLRNLNNRGSGFELKLPETRGQSSRQNDN